MSERSVALPSARNRRDDRLRRSVGPRDQPGDSIRDRLRARRRFACLHPAARHNLGVALPEGVELTIEGSVGYYVAGLNDGATVLVQGGAGWGAGESMRDGTVVIDGNAGNAVAASIRAGTVVVRGDASTRAGIAMKGGMLIVAGSVGPMAGFMMQKGVLIVCGDAAAGLADSMYAGHGFSRRQAWRAGGRRGHRRGHRPGSRADRSVPRALKVAAPPRGFRKVVAGRRLWNFQQSERELWKSAL